MGHQALAVSGLVLFFVILVAHFGSKFADRRERLTAAVTLAGIALLAAILVVPWELAMYWRDGQSFRVILAAAWSIIAWLLGCRFAGLVRSRQYPDGWSRSGRRKSGY